MLRISTKEQEFSLHYNHSDRFSPSSAIIYEIGHIQLPQMAYSYISKKITNIESSMIFWRPLFFLSRSGDGLRRWNLA